MSSDRGHDAAGVPAKNGGGIVLSLSHRSGRISRRTFTAIATAVVLVATLFAATPIARATTDHGNQACLDSDPRHDLLSGQTISGATTGRTGVYSLIMSQFDQCDGAGDDDSLSAAWIGMVPADPSVCPLPLCIVQVGIVACREPFTILPSICTRFPNQLRYFYAAGGCSTIGLPVAYDMGPAVGAQLGNYQIMYDGATATYTIDSPGAHVLFHDGGVTAVGCFNSKRKSAQYAVEKWDRGDSSGGPYTNTYFANMNYRTGTTWTPVNRGASEIPCTLVMSTAPHTSYCVMAGSQMWAWD